MTISMHPSETGRAYDSIARKWLEPHLRTNGVDAFRRALGFVKNRGRALDVGCGCNGRFEELLAAEGFEVEGLDVSAEMIALARERMPGVAFHHADICTWDFPRVYDFIAGWDSIWHVPLAQQEPVLRKICAGLAPGGVFLFTAGGLDEPSDKRDTCMGPEVYYSTLGIPALLRLLDESGCACRHLEFDQFPESHLCVIAQKAR